VRTPRDLQHDVCCQPLVICYQHSGLRFSLDGQGKQPAHAEDVVPPRRGLFVIRYNDKLALGIRGTDGRCLITQARQVSMSSRRALGARDLTKCPEPSQMCAGVVRPFTESAVSG